MGLPFCSPSPSFFHTVLSILFFFLLLLGKETDQIFYNKTLYRRRRSIEAIFQCMIRNKHTVCYLKSMKDPLLIADILSGKDLSSGDGHRALGKGLFKIYSMRRE